MDPVVILALIADLYVRLHQAESELAAARAELQRSASGGDS